MEKEFEDYWRHHQRRLLLSAPKEMRDELLESSRLDSPMDWLCFILPIGVGIVMQPFIRIKSEILSWAIMLVVVVVLFVLMQMVKPFVSKKKSSAQVVDNIKKYYYKRFKESGGNLEKIEPWH